MGLILNYQTATLDTFKQAARSAGWHDLLPSDLQVTMASCPPIVQWWRILPSDPWAAAKRLSDRRGTAASPPPPPPQPPPPHTWSKQSSLLLSYPQAPMVASTQLWCSSLGHLKPDILTGQPSTARGRAQHGPRGSRAVPARPPSRCALVSPFGHLYEVLLHKVNPIRISRAIFCVVNRVPFMAHKIFLVVLICY
jgi:hypothetical protein